MATLKINERNHTIEMPSKKFANAASRYGTEEYKMLQGARADYPNYKVVVAKSATRTKDSFKGLDYDFMESYIQKHDEDGSLMEAFKRMRGMDCEVASSLYYGEIKKWFLTQFPEIKKYESRTINGRINKEGVAA